LILKAAAGDVDFQARRLIGVENYTFFMQNREKGDYRLVPFAPFGQNYSATFFNFWHKDPILRKLFRNKKFRIALSIAIDRKEISELLYMGIAEPSQSAPTEPWYVEKYAKVYTEYNPKKANEILDELGLTWDRNHEYRLRPDGKRLEFVISTFTPHPPQNVETMELIKRYWKEIGIEAVNKPTDRALWITRVEACEHDVASYLTGFGMAGRSPTVYPDAFPFSQNAYWAPKWGLWFATKGKSGEEPPTEVKQLMKIYDKIRAETSVEKRIALCKEALKIHAENLWIIGIVARPTRGTFVVVKNDFRNVISPISFGGGQNYSAQYFFKR